MKTLKWVRVPVAAVTLTTAVVSASVILGPQATADYGTVTAKTAVNVRAGQGTNYKRYGLLYPGQSTVQTGPEQNGWTPVKYNGYNAWIKSEYLSSSKRSEPKAVTGGGSTGKMVTTDYLNVRTGPSVAHTRVGILAKGAEVSLTGQQSGRFVQITFYGYKRWISRDYLSGGGSSSGTINAAAATPAAPKTPSQVSPPKVPDTVATKYTTAYLNIRTEANIKSRSVTVVPPRTGLKLTGVVQDGWAQVVYNGAVRWASNRYLTATQPGETLDINGSKGLDKLQPSAKNIVREIRARYPQIKIMYGVRHEPGSDHHTGHAVDLMIPRYKTNTELGWQIAGYLKANASSLNIQYLIYQQKIWNISRDREGWRKMADRGSDTQNHYDHIHVSMKH